jgi:predicted esterase
MINTIIYIVLTIFIVLLVILRVVFPPFTIPKPTGPYAVGTATLDFVDPARTEAEHGNENEHRTLSVQFWYPADTTAGYERAPLFINSRSMTGAIAEVSGLHPFFYRTMKSAKTDSYINTPLSEKQKKFPILLFSHGLGQYLQQNITQMQELASHGFIVCSMAHTYYCSAVARKDGTIIKWIKSPVTPEEKEEAWKRSIAYNKRLRKTPGNEVEMQWEEVKAEGLFDKVVRIWCDDQRFILNKIEELNQGKKSNLFSGRIDLNNIGLFGFSFGGNIAVLSTLRDHRVKAGVNIDSTFWRHPDGIPEINKPIMDVVNDNYQKDVHDGYEFFPEKRNIALFEKNLNDAYYLRIYNATHANATDLAFLTPLLKLLKKTGNIGTQEYHRILNEYLLEFFNKYLYNKPSNLLDGEINRYKYVKLKAKTKETN